MKGFKFKLDALLKLREFNEQKAKTEVGKALTEVSRIKRNIQEIEESISEGYKAQENVMRTPSDGHMLKFFPFYLKSRQEDLKIQMSLLEKANENYENLLNKLKVARGEVKVLDKMKSREKKEFKKEKNKKETEEIVDILNLRRTVQEMER